jgi:polyvinyl alcohol dehydrogenase (cytochrome)
MTTTRLAIIAAVVSSSIGTVAYSAAMDGPTVYAQRCATCHENATDRIPPRAQLRTMPPDAIVTALVTGKMQPQAAGLNPEEVRNVAEFLTGRRVGEATATANAKSCSQSATALSVDNGAWNGWGVDIENTRYQPNPGLTVSSVPRLKVKWAYAYDGQSAAGQPTVIGNRLFVTHNSGRVTALDANTGCEYWSFSADGAVRTAVTVAQIKENGAKKSRAVAFFGTFKALAYAIDADTGQEIWHVKLDEHAVARSTGAPTYYNGVVYFPVSSHEETVARGEKYTCCTFRGAVSALDAATGKLIWKAFGIPTEAKPYKVNSVGTQMFGPAGGAIWSSPTVDAKRGLLYAGTGNSYTDVDTEGGNDSIVAFDIKTGRRVWTNQPTPKDSFILGCPKGKEGEGNCPQEGGPDYDFGSSPILRTLPSGKQIILAGQKSGMVYGLDPDKKGALVWQTRIGAGSALGGVEWGFSADLLNVYVPISDIAAGEKAAPGLYALQIDNGAIKWQTPTPTVTCSWSSGRCARAQPAASSTMPGVVFSGALDGHLRAYSTQNGAIIWDFDTAPALDTVNGLHVEGGSIDSTGPVIANGMVYVASGYGSWGKAGRLLIALSVDGK